MELDVKIVSKSVDTASYIKDYKTAIMEYLWNAFEANASEIRIDFEENVLNKIETISISDNGNGISYENLKDTFGVFLYSQKSENSFSNTLQKGNKGKGRFAFISLADNAEWETVYELDNKKYKYKISIDGLKKDSCTVTDKEDVTQNTGTKVNIYNIKNLYPKDINGNEFKDYVASTFAWLLYLNKSKQFKIFIQDQELKYDTYINEDESEVFQREIEGESFELCFIRWKKEIREEYYYYFIKDNSEIIHQQHTSFNKNAVGFIHSFYINSKYFNDFSIVNKQLDGQVSMQGKNQTDKTYKELLKELHKILEDKFRNCIKEKAENFIKDLNDEEIMPKFTDNELEQEKKKDLEEVIKSIYVIEPKIFIRSKIQQKKSLIGFLNLLLYSDERENIITIIDNVVRISKEERKELVDILNKTSLKNIVRTLKMIESRYEVVELLKKLVFDLAKYTTERNHVQKVIAENYWLFGEKYNMVAADEQFQSALENYMTEILGKVDFEIELYGDKKEIIRRPDIFICRKRKLTDVNDDNYEDNVIVELKRPAIMLKKEVFRQVEDYMDFVTKQPQFNSQYRKWKFIMLGKAADEYINGLYQSNKDKNKRFLVSQRDNFEIYAMTWDDLFKDFEIRHSYLYEKLDYDKEIIEAELRDKGVFFDSAESDNVRDKILELSQTINN